MHPNMMRGLGPERQFGLDKDRGLDFENCWDRVTYSNMGCKVRGV